MAAMQLARSGAKVLSVDKASHPRYKVCGCCLNEVALEILDAVGLKSRLLALNAVALDGLSLFAGSERADFPIGDGLAVSRGVLDYEMISLSIVQGAHYLGSITAYVGEIGDGFRLVHLYSGNQETTVKAKVVLVADGLNGRSLERIRLLPSQTANSARVGAGTIALNVPDGLFSKGVIYMSCGTGGYVGMVRLEDGSLDIAAAFERSFLRSFKDPGQAANAVVRSTNLASLKSASLDLSILEWHGTPPVTKRRKKLSAQRLCVVGDAASYAEPFTGEGMAWALFSGLTVVPILQKILTTNGGNSDCSEWDAVHKSLIVPRQRLSMVMAHFLRRPRLVELMAKVIKIAPQLASPLIRIINSSPGPRRIGSSNALHTATLDSNLAPNLRG
jgi:flavin-dependent dehydrogenase